DLLDLLGRVDRDLIVGSVAMLHAEVVVAQLDVEIWMDQFVLDEPPDDPGHLVPVELDDGILDFDLRHFGQPPFERGATPRQSAAIAAFSVALGRIAADALASSGR